ncbi:protein phosphatase Slingshot homolog 2-like isoform X2 [Dendronephthya gigantea]|uniref:protein phosphatase Slingshot homolog 2-like isoform X2 n=1 Tax=Dendronephthya gigantea TaxID=151771 RepID=UPI00106BEC8A|nr:protein phosphatase Slingshot homolog 2-like isoform X2 [Dendronephthya gigantea]
MEMASDKRVVQIFRRAVNKAKNINRWVKSGSSVEGFFASKGAAYAIPDGDFARKASLKGGEIQSHLQGMVNLIRDEDTMRLVVKVESEAKYSRYLCIVTTYGLLEDEESVILGIDWIEDEAKLGLVIPLWSNVKTKLDGDGGFEINTEHRNYIFKPVSVQTLWTALLWIHKCLKQAHRAKHFNGGLSHAWLDYYHNRITSPRECINFWESMDDVELKREIRYSYFDQVKTDEELLKGSIKNKLKEILTRFDLEEVTCRQVREALEAEMKMSLQHLKGYLDEQVFVILGQMESSTKITDHLYLGSEWNACNLQELKDNGVDYILNITKEVDNFFPGTFEYMNIRIYDLKESDLLSHWGRTYQFLHKAKEQGSAALVHCRRGISRSASTVIAFLMKKNNMCLADAMKFVKSKRSIVQPNSGFWKQLIIYEGILRSSNHRHNSLFRRRSNSVESGNVNKLHHKKGRHKDGTDQVDNSPNRGHTLPRMSNQVPPGGDGAAEDDILDSASSNEEDTSSNSNSDEEQPSTNNGRKIRRTVSEPTMMHSVDVMMMSPPGKPRARTFVEKGQSPTRILEDLEAEDSDAVLFETGDDKDVLEKEEEARVLETVPDCARSEPGTIEASVDGEKESADLSETPGMTTTNTEPPANAGEVKPNELLNDVKQLQCEYEDSPVEDAARDLSPRVDLSSAVISSESPREDSSHDEHATPPRTPRQRSRSIGEKLLDKLLVKQGRSESSDNLKKVSTRGRVKRRERKAKSDLQLSSSGFVKRHTQILEDERLYSLLLNSNETLATLAKDFWEERGSPAISKENSCEEAKNLDSESTVTSIEDSKKDSEKPSGEYGTNSFEPVKSSKGECSSDGMEIPGKDQQDYSQAQVENHSKQSLSQNSEDVSQKDSENCSGATRSQELQNIVQEVNAEAKRDIATQGEPTRAAVVSQNALRHTNQDDDVTIDPMTWIDLTQHRGDVVKRRSAAFENNSIEEPWASVSPSRDKSLLSRDRSLESRDDHEQNVCQCPEQAQETRKTDESKMKDGSPKEVPKLNLKILEEEGGSPTQRSNSITVEDYNSWEASSVRDRTMILENIIARTGGSFPSPRSRALQKNLSSSEAETQVQHEMSELTINTLAKPDNDGFCHQSYAEDQDSTDVVPTASEQPDDENVFGDAPVKSLVDKFEVWG